MALPFPLAALAAFALMSGDGGELADRLARAAPQADPRVLQLASQAVACARIKDPASRPRTLSVIDYTRPSTQRRLWVFDLEPGKLLFEEWVAHGRNSGGDLAEHFSNETGSLMSSVGLFQTGDAYRGHNGYSLRLRGLDAGFNDNAIGRAIVMHGADYVSEAIARDQGRLGRSLGCPAVRREVALPLIDAIRDGSLVFAYFPLADWLQHSPYLGGCGAAGSATAAAAP
jgi:hypothetical protein